MGVSAVEIVVIGGGVGGLTAALALALGGHRVQGLERPARFAQGGPALRLAPNATAVLARLGLLDQVLDLGSRPRRAVLRALGSGAELAELDLGAPLTARYGTPYVVVGRADLLSLLADACADADGAQSAARALLGGSGPAGDGWAAYRGTVPVDALAAGEADDEVVAWTGPDAHFTRYPIRVGEAYEQVAVFRSHLYPLVGAASPGGAGQGPPPTAPAR